MLGVRPGEQLLARTVQEDIVNITKAFGRSVTHAPSGTGTDPLCMPYGGNGSHGAWSTTTADVTCKRCKASMSPCECDYCTTTPPYTPGDHIPANACPNWAG